MNINITSCANQNSYGIVGLAICRELDRLGHNVAWFGREFGGIELDEQAYPNDKHLIQKWSTNALNPDFNAPSLRIFHQFSLATHVGKGPKIGFPIFELDKFTPRELNHLRNQDRLFVTSEWARNIIQKNGINVPTHVVPLGYDPNVFFPKVELRQEKLSQRGYTFVNVGKLEPARKGQRELIEIFNETFRQDDEVQLIMANGGSSWVDAKKHQEFKKWSDSTPLGNKITHLPGLNSQVELNNLYNICDCIVSPSRAEGWDLPLLEAVGGVGLYGIASNGSAHTEFCYPDLVTLVDFDGEEVANDGQWFHGQGKWGKIGDSFRKGFGEAMREHYDSNKKCVLPKPNRAATYTWENTATVITNELRDI